MPRGRAGRLARPPPAYLSAALSARLSRASLMFNDMSLKLLKLRLPAGAVIDYILDTPAFRAKIPHGKLLEVYERLTLFNLALEHYVAGGILCELLRTVGPFNRKLRFPDEKPSDEILGGAIDAGTRLGVSAVQEQLKNDARLLLDLIDSNFRMELPPPIANSATRCLSVETEE